MDIELGSIADWASAIATTFAALTSLFIAKKATKRKATVSAEINSIIEVESMQVVERIIVGKITNLGNTTIFLESASIQIFEKRFLRKNKFIQKIVPVFEPRAIPKVHQSGSTISLVPGDSYTVHYNFKEVLELYNKRFSDPEKYIVQFTFQDTLGIIYYSNPIQEFNKESSCYLQKK